MLGVHPYWHWFAFGILVIVLLSIDLLAHRKAHAPTLTESTLWSLFWIALALAFNGFVWWWRGSNEAILFLTAYVVEKSLSVANIFVFAVIFRMFAVPLKYQHNVLFWGILGAVVLRLIFILLGTTLVHYFDWTLPVFGAFLLYTGIQLVFKHGHEVDPNRSWLLRFGRKVLPLAHNEHGGHFFARENGRFVVTRLFLVLLVVESTDVLFAVDSVPAIIGITSDPFLVFTSNIFAILGLRALYFVLAGVIDMFRYLHYGLSAVLVFVGLKMIVEYLAEQPFAEPYVHVEEGHHLIPPWVSLAIVGALLTVSIVASIIANRRDGHHALEEVPLAPEALSEVADVEADSTSTTEPRQS